MLDFIMLLKFKILFSSYHQKNNKKICFLQKKGLVRFNKFHKQQNIIFFLEFKLIFIYFFFVFNKFFVGANRHRLSDHFPEAVYRY